MARVKNINANKLNEWLEQDSVILVDVREPDEYRHEHIKQAINMPLSSLAGQEVPCPEGKKIVFQCRTGNRSLKAAEVSVANEDEEPFYHLEGGIEDWKKAGFAVKAEKNAGLPIIRQVQITVGLLVILSVLLGYFVHPVFLILTLAFGAGLMNAGITGWCGMANALMQMPWNKKVKAG